MKRQADWFAWSLQFILGLIVGVFLGFCILGKRRGSDGWLNLEQMPIFILGAALIGAGLASFHGDRLWLGSSYSVISPDGIEHNDKSRIASIITGALGVTLILIAILRHFEAF
jgi:hypothetical protein